MVTSFLKHINQQLVSKSETYLLAISGGIDSMVMAHLCKEANLKVTWAHCNFSLRGKESDIDEIFVKEKAEAFGVNCFSIRFATTQYATEHKVSTQIAARELRYAWFRKLQEEYDFDYIFTAHHANDSLETFFINLLRGTGLKGLVGIPEKTENIFRPLLPYSRKEIERYAKKHQITWREDQTNASTSYLRNKIRHQVVPWFEGENSHFLTTFKQTQEHLKASETLVEDYINLLKQELFVEKDNVHALNISQLKQKPHYNQILYRLLSPYGFTAWEDIYNLLEGASGKQIFSTTHRLLKHRDFLLLSEISAAKTSSYLLASVQETLAFPLGKLTLEIVGKTGNFDKNIAYVDNSLITYPLEVRKWKAGDKFKPFGMKGNKKVSDFLKDEKCSLLEKENTWLLCAQNRIIWIINHRIDEAYKITNKTTEILKITLIS